MQLQDNQRLIISAIVALGENRVIGVDNRLPWHLPADLKRFKTITTGHPILMGRKTFQSIGRALPHRTNIVITHDKNFFEKDVIVVNSIEEGLYQAKQLETKEIFVIGGAQIYQQALPYLERIYLTVVHCQPAGNAFFPELIESEWREIESITYPADDKNNYAYSFLTLERVKLKS